MFVFCHTVKSVKIVSIFLQSALRRFTFALSLNQPLLPMLGFDNTASHFMIS